MLIFDHPWSALVVAWAGFTIGAALYAWLPWRRARRRRVENGSAAEVVLLRACAGAEPELLRCLSSLPTCDASLSLTVRFAIPSRNDAAAPAVVAAARTLASRGIDAAIVETGAGGPNNKAHQLAVALAHIGERESFVVVADSDVDLDAVPLRDLVAPLHDANVGAVWAPPVEVCSRTFGDRASAAVLDASLHAFPVLALLDGTTMVGKLFATRAADLRRVGGFESLRTHLGEDAELSRRLRALGVSVRTAPFVARSTVRGRSFAAVNARFARWLWVVRSQRAALLISYPILLAPLPAMLAVALVGHDRWLGFAIVAAFAARLIVAALARRISSRPMRWASLPIDAVLADVALLFALARTLSTRRVPWRGRSLRIDGGGRLALDE